GVEALLGGGIGRRGRGRRLLLLRLLLLRPGDRARQEHARQGQPGITHVPSPTFRYLEGTQAGARAGRPPSTVVRTGGPAGAKGGLPPHAGRDRGGAPQTRRPGAFPCFRSRHGLFAAAPSSPEPASSAQSSKPRHPMKMPGALQLPARPVVGGRLMDRVRLQPLRRLPHLLVLGGLPLFGCAQYGPSATVTAPAAVAGAPSADAVVQASTAAVTGTEPAAEAPKALPINLDTVFRLAEGQNALIGQARAKVQEAVLEKNVAGGRWLPNVWVGVTYARHHGGSP